MVVKKARLREDVSKSSAACGELRAGNSVLVLAAARPFPRNSLGRRLRTEQGWVSEFGRGGDVLITRSREQPSAQPPEEPATPTDATQEAMALKAASLGVAQGEAAAQRAALAKGRRWSHSDAAGGVMGRHSSSPTLLQSGGGLDTVSEDSAAEAATPGINPAKPWAPERESRAVVDSREAAAVSILGGEAVQDDPGDAECAVHPCDAAVWVVVRASPRLRDAPALALAPCAAARVTTAPPRAPSAPPRGTAQALQAATR